MTRRAALVRAGQDCAPANGQQPFAPPAPGHRLLNLQLCAVQLHRRQKLSVRQVRQPLGLAAHADELLDIGIPGGDIRITQRPVHSEAFLRIGFKVQITPAINLPTPHDRAPTDMPASDPGKGLVGIVVVGVLPIVHEEFRAPLIARPGQRLNRLLFAELAQISVTPIREGVRLHVLHIVSGWHDRRPSLKHQGSQAFLRQLLGGPAAGNSGADHDRVEFQRARLRRGHSRRTFRE